MMDRIRRLLPKLHHGQPQPRPYSEISAELDGRDEMRVGPLSEDELRKIRHAAHEDRARLNYTAYEVGPDHSKRVTSLGHKFVAREDWWTHPMYRRRPQMPPYHVHFREELQDFIKLLLIWYTAEREPPAQYLQAGRDVFRGCMRGLRGHVGIEEHHVFPELQRAHPDIDISFLYEDHIALSRMEQKLAVMLERAEPDADVGVKAQILRTAMDLDRILMTHLGEEEEIVVPLTLSM